MEGQALSAANTKSSFVSKTEIFSPLLSHLSALVVALLRPEVTVSLKGKKMSMAFTACP